MAPRYILALLAYSVSVVLSCKIIPNTDIAFGQNIGQASGHSTATSCCSACAGISGCVAFTWNNWNGGTCYFKGTASPQISKSGVTAGVISDSPTCSGPRAGYDISGHDLKHVSGKTIGNCCGLCDSTTGCRSFSWTNFQGGTCWLKDQDGPFVQKPGASAAVLHGSGPSPGKRWRVLKEFDMTARDSVTKEWDIKVWQPGHINNELEAYIDSSSTLFAKDGGMVIKGFKQGNRFVSARIESKQRFNAANVHSKMIRYEFTGTVPTAKGAWPAYWVLGDGNKYGGWPKCGEIDIMEWVFNLQNDIKSSLHWKSGADWGTDYQLSQSDIRNEYYTYGAEVSAVPNNEYVQFYIRQPDGKTRYGNLAKSSTWEASFPTCRTFTPGASKCSPLAPFDNDMFLIINLAIGGDWGGLGVHGDYSAFDGDGVEMKIKNVIVYEAV